ncbi:uncharacterized protein [Macrobrachium rosenbergii]|uniref:uncharacterized protein n=1 Tax=Macrobrachium rosenbergii TaxID=79674 RepID=UPI0034D59546
MPGIHKALSVLSGLLLIFRGISASRILPTNQETYLEVDPALSGEPTLTRLEGATDNVETASRSPFIVTTSGHMTPSHLTDISRAFFTTSPLNPLPERDKWGSHPIGSKEDFEIKDDKGDRKWLAYFYDQAVVAVLLMRNGTMLECTVQENIQKWEQEKALEYLSEIMPLRPIAFDSMVHLITLCGTLNIPPTPAAALHQAGTNPLWWLDFSTIQGILPGTLWCGVRDKATYYRDLGPRQKVDNCCRAHDLCPIKISGLTTRYGTTNLGLNTLSHCTCDLEFYRCLKAANSDVANMVGQVYFNYLDIKCLDAPPKTKTGEVLSNRPPRGSVQSSSNQEEVGRLECILFDEERECRKWELTPANFSVELVISRLGLSF